MFVVEVKRGPVWVAFAIVYTKSVRDVLNDWPHGSDCFDDRRVNRLTPENRDNAEAEIDAFFRAD